MDTGLLALALMSEGLWGNDCWTIRDRPEVPWIATVCR